MTTGANQVGRLFAISPGLAESPPVAGDRQAALPT